MDSLFATFTNSLIALTLCIAVGFVCRRCRIISDENISGLTGVLVNVGMPSTIFISMMRPFTMALLLESAATFLLTGVFYLVGGGLALLLARVMKANTGERQAWVFGLIFGNVGFMGFPVIAAVFGYEGMIYAAMANASFNLLVFTVGRRIYSGSERINVLKILRAPALVATIVGMIFFVTGLRLPAAVESGVGLLSGLTTPVSLIIVGATVARQRLWEMFSDIRFYPAAGVKLIVLPLLAVLALRPFVFIPDIMLGVIVTLVAMPAAAATVVFAEDAGGDTSSAAKIVMLSTLLCIVTVPLISFLL